MVQLKRTFSFLALVVLAGPLRAGTEPRTILDFPFENRSPRADLAWISESFADTLTSRLASFRRIVLEREERNAAGAEMAPRAAQTAQCQRTTRNTDIKIYKPRYNPKYGRLWYNLTGSPQSMGRRDDPGRVFPCAP